MESLPKNLLNKYRLPLGVFLILAIVAGGGILALTGSRRGGSEIEKVEVEATASGALSPVTKIKVDVAGAVKDPGVYELPEDGRVEDALNAAEGFSEQVDKDWVAKNLNLAAKLSDGDKLYIPKVGETSSATNKPAAAASVPPAVGVVSGAETPPVSGGCDKVNINKASAGTLADCLSGIGESKAQSIIKYREDHGGFKSIGEIQEVSGIGPKTFEKIKDQLTVN